MKILFSWVGHTDLFGFADEYPEVRKSVQNATGKMIPVTTGPVKVAIKQHTFDKIVL